MTKEEFVKRMLMCVRDSAIESAMERLRKPPGGRRPRPNLVRRFEWFSRLMAEDRQQVEEVVGTAADSAVFGFLCILDGVSKWDDRDGLLELTYIGEERVLLNSPDGEELHDLFQPFEK